MDKFIRLLLEYENMQIFRPFLSVSSDNDGLVVLCQLQGQLQWGAFQVDLLSGRAKVTGHSGSWVDLTTHVLQVVLGNQLHRLLKRDHSGHIHVKEKVALSTDEAQADVIGGARRKTEHAPTKVVFLAKGLIFRGSVHACT